MWFHHVCVDFSFFTFLGPCFASGSNFNAVSPLWQSVEQIGNRADRLSIGADELFLYSNTEIEVHDSGLDSFYFNDYFNFSQSCCSYSDHSKIYVILFWYKSLLFFEFQIYVVGFLIGLHSVDVRYQHQVAEKKQLSLNPIYNVINAKWMFEEDIDAKWKLLLI